MISELLSKWEQKAGKEEKLLFMPYASAGCRKQWENLDPEVRESLIQQGEAYLGFEYPFITAVDYMDFVRTGNRSRFSTKYSPRRQALTTLVLAECAEYQGRFLDDILNGIYAVCGEFAWQLPAHNYYTDGVPQILPDTSRPVVALMSAETGAILAATEYLLRDELEKISPVISKMIKLDLKTRIVDPYLKEHFWWMGDGKRQMNNWTVWCTQNVLLTVFMIDSPDYLTSETKHRILRKACRSIDYFLEEYEEDGCCDEGPHYYQSAGLCLFNCLEILNGITCGGFSKAFQMKKICNIASYILNVHADGDYYINFADCSAVIHGVNAREYLFGKRTGSEELKTFAASCYRNSQDQRLKEEKNLFYRLQSAFTHKEMISENTESAIHHKDLYYESAGLFIVRDERFCLSVKAGNNGDSHNHNDVGSFILYKNGNPMFLDVGVETYTKQTFSDQRYEIWTMQSSYHNLPAFYDGEQEIMQHDGIEYRAKDVQTGFGKELCWIALDLSEAYPDRRIRSYSRKVSLQKGGSVKLEDHYDGTLKPVLNFMVYEKPAIVGNTVFLGELGTCIIEGSASITMEEIPVIDGWLKKSWKHGIYRLRAVMEKQDFKMIIN